MQVPNLAHRIREPDTAARKQYDVLLVEDDRALREQLALALTDEGYTVATSENGAEALELLHQADVRLLVLDLMLPVMNGRELTRILQTDAQLASIPIVMITAVNNVHIAPPGPVYLKPLHRTSFLRAVELHIRRGHPSGTC